MAGRAPAGFTGVRSAQTQNFLVQVRKRSAFLILAQSGRFSPAAHGGTRVYAGGIFSATIILRRLWVLPERRVYRGFFDHAK
jgi:hypothetical protein